MTPSPAATTGWMPVCTSAPVCSHTAPDGQARSGTPLQYRHWLPKPRQCGDHVVAVHINGARLERMRHAMGAAHVLRPDTGHQSVDRAVRLRDQVVLVAERDRGDHRPEDLLARDTHLAVDIGEHGRFHEVA